jgi:hypothetical protein
MGTWPPMASSCRLAFLPFRRCVVALLLGIPLPAAPADDEIRIVLRSFIPNVHTTNPAYVLPVPGAPRKSMIPGPGASARGGECYETDHRSFSPDPDASARVTTDFVLLAASPPGTRLLRGGIAHRAGATVQRDCATGKELARKNAHVENCSIGKPAAADGQVQVVVGCRAGNPFFLVAPQIEYNGSFTYNKATKTLSFTGTVGDFPAFEAYASLNGKPLVKLFAIAPKPGATVWNLWDLGLGFSSRAVEVKPTKL